MNLSAPPPSCDTYAKKIYDFLQHPAFDQIRLRPRSAAPDNAAAGQLYYLEGDGLQVGNGSSYSSAKGGSYVQRTDGTSWDFHTDDGDFSTFGSWANLDLSSIVPVGVKILLLNVELYLDDPSPCNNTVKRLSLRYGNYQYDLHQGNCTVLRRHQVIMPVYPFNGILQYYQTADTALYDAIEKAGLVVQGWFT